MRRKTRRDDTGPGQVVFGRRAAGEHLEEAERDDFLAG